jgi:hypothetical protein
MASKHAAILKRLVEQAAATPAIVAIGTYGSTATESWSEHSDLDLIFILDQDAPVNSIHFFVGGIPVDLNLKSRDSWSEGDTGWLPPEPVRPIWDPVGFFERSNRLRHRRRMRTYTGTPTGTDCSSSPGGSGTTTRSPI